MGDGKIIPFVDYEYKLKYIDYKSVKWPEGCVDPIEMYSTFENA